MIPGRDAGLHVEAPAPITAPKDLMLRFLEACAARPVFTHERDGELRGYAVASLDLLGPSQE
jgi:hypothetical protein